MYDDPCLATLSVSTSTSTAICLTYWGLCLPTSCVLDTILGPCIIHLFLHRKQCNASKLRFISRSNLEGILVNVLFDFSFSVGQTTLLGCFLSHPTTCSWTGDNFLGI